MIKFPLVPGKMKKYLIPTTVVLQLSACSSYNEDNPLVPVPQKSYSSTTPNWNKAIRSTSGTILFSGLSTAGSQYKFG